MANWQNLITSVKDVIKMNGNNEITGTIMQNVLSAIIANLGEGYQFKGVAQPNTIAGIPDGRFFYLATTPGIYYNFNSFVVPENSLSILYFDNTWRGEVLYTPMIQNGSITIEMLSNELKQFIGSAGDIENNPDGEDLTIRSISGVDKISFANREYAPLNYSGRGYVILRKNINELGVNVLSQTNINKTNCDYIIRYDFNLQGEIINIPENCRLIFAGGKLSNGQINFNNTNIDAGLVQIFDIDIEILGTLKIEQLCPEWFGAIGDGINDDLMFIQKAVNVAINMNKDILLNNKYVISDSIVINRPFSFLEWFTLKGNNRSSISCQNNKPLFTTTIDYDGIHSHSHYIRFIGITFNGNPTNNVLDGNRFLRIEFINCNFNICLLQSSHYIQSYYLSHCTIANYQGYWLYLTNGLHDVKLSQCSFEYANGTAIWATGGDMFAVNTLSIIGCLFEAQLGSAIAYNKVASMSIIGCYFEDNKRGHIVAVGAEEDNGIVLLGNTFNEIYNGLDNTDGSGCWKIVWWNPNNCISIGNMIGDGSYGNTHYIIGENQNITIKDSFYEYNSLLNVATTLTGLENLNYIKITGVYMPMYANLVSPNVTGLNYPVPKLGILEVVANRGIIKQTFTVISKQANEYPEVYIRTFCYPWIGGWTMWLKIPNS